MKISVLFVSYAAAKTITTAFDDLSNIAVGLSSMVSGSLFPDVTLHDEILKWEYDAYDATQAAKSEISNKDLHTILGRGNILNMQAMIAVVLGPDTNPAQRANEPQNKYSMYGCYCTPHHAQMVNSLWLGKGEPVDDIDFACRHLFWGYKCLTKDYGENCDSSKSYNWAVDNAGGVKCGDKKGTCKGDLCRLDLAFTQQLQSVADVWNPEFHYENGFDRNTDCKSSYKVPKAPTYPQATNGGQTQGSDTQCCGKGLLRHMYSSDRLECCKDGTTKAIGNCGA